MADREVTLDDIRKVREMSPQVTREVLPVSRPQPQAATEVEPQGSMLDRFNAWDKRASKVLTSAAENEWAPYAVARMMALEGIEADPDFDLGRDVEESEWEELTATFDEDTKERIAASAKGRTHLYALVDQTRELQQNDEYIADAGGWGVAASMATILGDPTNVALAIGTGGIGVAHKADRLSRAIRTATSLADRRAAVAATQAAAQAGHMGNVLKIGALSAAENAALESVLVEGNLNRDGWDVAYAGMGGLVLGAGVGRWLSGSEQKQLQKLHSLEKGRLENMELRAAVSAKADEIRATLGADEAVARAQVGDAVVGAVRFLGGRDTDLTDYAPFRHALESGGRANAKATTSSALGVDQFLADTWKNVVAQVKPKWAEGLSEEALLALRADPQKSAEMVAALDAQNARMLRQANAPVNHFSMYAMHHFGPKGGKKFALADADTPMEEILSKAQLKANPYLKGKTKAQAMANWTERARKHGVDTDAMVERIPANGAEARRAEQIANFDRDGATTRLKDLEDTLKAHQDQVASLSKDAEGIVPSGELRKLRREVDALQKELKGAKGTPTFKLQQKVEELEQLIADLPTRREAQLAFLRNEDELKLGADVANSKHYANLREGVVDKRIGIDQDHLTRQLKKAKHDRDTARYTLKERLAGLEPRAASAEKAAAAQDTLKALLKQDNTPLSDEAAKLREALGMDDAARSARDADDAARGDLKDLLTALKPRREALDKLDALAKVGDAANLREEALKATGSAPTFGADTLSAARTVGFDAGLHPALEDKMAGLTADQMNFAGAVRFFGKGTFSGVLRGSDNEVVRSQFGVLVGNPLGNKGDSVVDIGASEVASEFLVTQSGKFNAAVDAAMTKWLKERGQLSANRWRRSVRNEFMTELGLHIRGQESASPAVKAAAGRVREVMAEFLTEAKRHGVQGFENVEINGNYLPRVFNFHKLHDLGNRVGYDNLTLLIQKGMQQTHENLDDKTASRIAGLYVKRMRELRVGNDAGLMQGMSFDDVGFLRQFLGEAELQADEIESIVAKFAGAKRPSKAKTKPLAAEARKLREKQRLFKDRVKTRAALGKGSPKAEKRLQEIQTRLDEIAAEIEAARAAPDASDVMKKEGGFRHAKMRQQFDENFALDLTDFKSPTNEVIRVRISDLFENNVESLFGRYSRTMAGHIGLAKVGIRSRADFNERMRLVERALEDKPGELKDVKKMATAAYDLLTARPLQDSNVWTELARTGRDMAYATQMENAGIANIPDMASLLAWGNFRYTAKTFFGGDVFGAMWTRGEDGRLLNAEWREIEETFGSGTDYLSSQVFSSYDVTDDFVEGVAGNGKIVDAATRGFAAVSHGARVAGRAVTAGSGLAAISSMAQRMAARNAIYRIKDDVLRKGGFNKARAARLGLDEAMSERIAEQFRRHTGKLKSEFGTEVETSNFQKWDDLDARDHLIYAVQREVKKNVQKEDLGDTLLLQHKAFGKVITQFRRFGLTAWTKQTLRLINERDAEAITRAMIQMTMAAGVWKLRHEIVIAGMEAAGADPEEIEKYRKERLAPDRIMAAGLRNSGVAALLPDVYDSTVGAAVGKPFFDVRNTGNSSNLLSGIPLVSLTSTMGSTAAGLAQAAIRGDRQVHQQVGSGIQALTPFGHHLLVQPGYEALKSHLPEQNLDDDPDNIEWFK